MFKKTGKAKGAGGASVGPVTRSPGAYLKARETRRRILDAALGLFMKVGYEKATMRVIARKAGVQPSHAYYYFATKEHLIFEFYARAFEEQMPGVKRVLEGTRALRERLAGSVNAHLEIARPYRGISMALLRTAIAPDHPLSPFSDGSEPIRSREIALFGELLDGSDVAVPAEIRKHLPELLWLWKMGVILYWLYDRSPDQRQTSRFVDRTAGLIVTLVRTSRLPVLKGIALGMIGLFVEFKPYGRKEAGHD